MLHHRDKVLAVDGDMKWFVKLMDTLPTLLLIEKFRLFFKLMVDDGNYLCEYLQ